MKFRVERDVLTNAVTWVARTLPARPPVPVLAGLRIEADESGKVVFSSFDYSTSAQCEIAAEVEIPGLILVSGRLLSDICRALPPKPVDLEVEGSKVTIRCGSACFNILTMPIDDYPQLPKIPNLIGYIDAQTLAVAASQAIMSASQQDTIPLLNSVRLEIENSQITFLSTDRYRLTIRDIDWEPNDKNISVDALINAHDLSDIAKNLTNVGKIGLHIDLEGSNLVGFSADGRQTTVTLIDGQYPAVRSLFPTEINTYVVISREELLKATGRVSLVGDKNSSLLLSFTDGEVRLEAGQIDDSQASEVIPATLVGEDIVAAFKAEYLLSGLNALKTKYARLSFTHQRKPAVLSGQEEINQEVDETFKYLLMPVHHGV